MKIAAYVNSRGNPVSLYEPGAIRLYEVENLPPAPPSWRLVREIPFAVDRTMAFLKRWLENHICREDKTYVGHLLKSGIKAHWNQPGWVGRIWSSLRA